MNTGLPKSTAVPMLVGSAGEGGTGFYRFLCLGAAEGERSAGRPRPLLFVRQKNHSWRFAST